jgi:ligand-binding sensor domain-containing protein
VKDAGTWIESQRGQLIVGRPAIPKEPFFLSDPHGTLWFGTDHGLFALSGTKLNQFTTADGLPSEIVGAICPDGEGALWIGTGGGVARLPIVA